MSDPIDLTLLIELIRVIQKAEPLWKCVSHNCDVVEPNEINLNEKFDPREEYCSIESEWGSLDPKNCEIVRGVFVPMKASA